MRVARVASIARKSPAAPAGEESFADLKLGVSYARKAGVHHNVINANDFEYAFVEIELKS